MQKHLELSTRKEGRPNERANRYRCYGIQVLKLDNPGAGTQFYVADEGHTLVRTRDGVTPMSQSDAKSILLSTPLHRLLLSLDGVMETQVMKLW